MKRNSSVGKANPILEQFLDASDTKYFDFVYKFYTLSILEKSVAKKYKQVDCVLERFMGSSPMVVPLIKGV